MADTVQVGDIGTKIILDCVEDISTSTVWKIKYEKPDGSSGSWTAVKEGTTVYYTTAAVGDLDQDGCWCLQSYIESTAWTGHGERVSLEVSKNC